MVTLTPPELKLQGEDLLLVYVQRAMVNPAEQEDWMRLAFLGSKLLDLAITRHWLAKSDPLLSVEDIQVRVEGFLQRDDLLETCIEEYELNRRLLRLPETPVGIRECRDFLSITVAKHFERGGMSEVQGWVSALIEPGSIPPAEPTKPIESDPPSLSGLQISPHQSSQAGPSLPPQYSPPIPVPVPDADPLSFVTLQVFNEHATQKRNHQVSWKDTHSGEAHRTQWTVECLLDGVTKGVGHGSAKNAAKTQAARETWRIMGWSSPMGPSSPPLSPQSPNPSIQLSLPPAYSPNGDNSLSWLTLSTFNHVADRQYGLNVGWEQERTGEVHLPTWSVTCTLNGEPKGTGTARNTKDAKLDAARETWRMMAWGMVPPQ